MSQIIFFSLRSPHTPRFIIRGVHTGCADHDDSLVLVSLDNVQDHLENPYDGVGSDDLRLDIAQAYNNLLQKSTRAETI